MERQIGQYSNIRFPILIIRFPISIIRFPILTIRFLFPIIRLSILIIRFLLSIIRLSILIFRFLFFTYICMVCCGIFSESQVLLPTDQGLCTYAHLSSLLRPCAETGRVTRGATAGNLQLPLPSTESGKKAFSFIGPSLWNTLDIETKQCMSISTFITSAKRKFYL